MLGVIFSTQKTDEKNGQNQLSKGRELVAQYSIAMCLVEGSPPLPDYYWLTAPLIALIHEIKNKEMKIKKIEIEK